MKYLLSLLTLCFLPLSIQAQSTSADPLAYRLVDSAGRSSSFARLVEQAAEADVVFFGELHNNPIAHWMQLRLFNALAEKKGKQLALGLEMLEADNQLIVDEYMSRTISPKRYGDEARLWPNYETDYDPVVYRAKELGLPVIATNVPRRYADLVNRKSLRALDSLSPEAKRFIAPLPIPYKQDAEQEGMFAAMGMLAHGSGKEKTYLQEAQAIKDATMGYFIAQHLQPKGTFLHLNGSFHSLAGSGIIPYLLHYAPKTKILTISTVLQEELGQLDEDYRGSADYIFIIPEDMTRTH